MNSIFTKVFLLSRCERESVECNRDCIICGSVGAVCKLEWVSGFLDNGVDVGHDQPFKALHGYRRECYGSNVRECASIDFWTHRWFKQMYRAVLWPLNSPVFCHWVCPAGRGWPPSTHHPCLPGMSSHKTPGAYSLQERDRSVNNDCYMALQRGWLSHSREPTDGSVT
jgi:hypothetical protein